MTDTETLDKAHYLMMRAFIETGQALHYTELGGSWSLAPEQGKALLHDLMGSGVPAWVFPDTDYVASFAPFNNLPTQYRISVGNQQKWFAQWGFEALAVCWLFPGKEITIDAPCLDCGEPLQVRVREGEILSTDPGSIFGYIDIPFNEWRNNRPYSWSRMNLFRSEEHARNWVGFKIEAEAGLLPLSSVMRIFSAELFRRRGDADYIFNLKSHYGSLIETAKVVTNDHPFWRRDG